MENLPPLQAGSVLKETVLSSLMNDPGLNQAETLSEDVRVVYLCYCSCMAPHLEETDVRVVYLCYSAIGRQKSRMLVRHVSR